MSDPIRQQLITDQVVTRFGGSLTDPQPTNTWLSYITVYRSEIPASPPVYTDSGRTKPYLVIWPSGAAATADQDLGDQTVDVDYGMQVDCVAGFVADLEHLVDLVTPRIYRWSPTIADLAFGGFRPPVGFRPGPVQKNDAVNPPRFWLPLQFRLTAAR